jgi:hypothetical protein
LWRALGPLLAAVCVLVVLKAPVNYGGSDPYLSFVTSLALIETGSTRLDPYLDRIEVSPTHYAIEYVDGHAYYYFPHGPAYFSTPSVWIASTVGVDVTRVSKNSRVQRLLATLTCVLALVLFHEIFRACGVGRGWAWGLASLFTFGTGATSTMGSALWSINYAVLFTAAGLLLLLYLERRPDERWAGVLLGLLLLGAFLSRPTTAFFIAATLGWLAFGRRRAFLPTAVTAGGGLAIWMSLVYLEQGRWLPTYYGRAGTALGNPAFTEALYGTLLSPSRGLLVFSPFLIVGLLLSVRYAPSLLRRGPAWVAAAAFLGTWISVSGFHHWWGGHSYGPRLLTETYPVFAALTGMAWAAASRQERQGPGTFPRAMLIGLGVVAIWINAWQGLHNRYTTEWNVQPSVDHYPEYIFDWRYPQFLAKRTLLYARSIEHAHLRLSDRTPVPANPTTLVVQGAAGDQAALVGWGAPDQGVAWARGSRAAVLFRSQAWPADQPPDLVLGLRGPDGTRARVLVNDREVGTIRTAWTGVVCRWPLPGDLLGQAGVFRVNLQVLKRDPLTGERIRFRSIGLESLALEAASDPGTSTDGSSSCVTVHGAP